MAGPSFVLECFFTNCCFTGRQSSSKVSHETISQGTGTISKCWGIWEGQWVQRMLVSSSSDWLLFLERASAMWFSDPQNHWLYVHILLGKIWEAWIWATLSLILAWMRSLPSSKKFVIWSYPSNVVLSPIEREQSPSLSWPVRMTIDGDINAMMCLSRLFDARNFRFPGRQNLHTKPGLLYPPKPAGQKSDL